MLFFSYGFSVPFHICLNIQWFIRLCVCVTVEYIALLATVSSKKHKARSGVVRTGAFMRAFFQLGNAS